MKGSVAKLIDASIVLAAISGMMYICGYVFHEGFYGELMIPVRALDLKLQDVILYGSLPITLLLILGGCILIITALSQGIIIRLSKHPKIPSSFKTTATLPIAYSMGLVSFAVAIIFLTLIEWSNYKGKISGKAFLDGTCPIADIQVASADGKESRIITGCFVTTSAEFSWIIPMSASGLIEKRAISIPVKSILQVDITPGALEDKIEFNKRFHPMDPRK